MLSMLFLGFLIGMQHALEADHLAAVSSLASGETSVGRIVRHGAVWGLGHTLTLMAVAGAAIILNLSIGAGLAAWLEIGVGLMLVGLGGQLLYRLAKERIHFHRHRHDDGVVHFHVHSHADARGQHVRLGHQHAHPKGLPIRTLLVGMMHGMAGSAALLVLSAAAIDSPSFGIAYVALFGIGSVAGMALLSAAIAVPIAYSARFLTWSNRALQAAVGAGTVALGVAILA